MTAEESEVEGRAARLKAAFPGAYHEDGAFVSFDMRAIAEAIGMGNRVETRPGLRFERYRDEVWVSAEVQIGNVVSAWSWKLSSEDWDRIVKGMECP